MVPLWSHFQALFAPSNRLGMAYEKMPYSTAQKTRTQKLLTVAPLSTAAKIMQDLYVTECSGVLIDGVGWRCAWPTPRGWAARSARCCRKTARTLGAREVINLAGVGAPMDAVIAAAEQRALTSQYQEHRAKLPTKDADPIKRQAPAI